MKTVDKLNAVLSRTVPITDPSYIVGENNAINKLDKIFKSIEVIERGLAGCVILGQVGNGKTHFLRYTRQHYKKQDEGKSAIGIYIPDMFVSGPLVDSLNGIYKSMFNGPGNRILKEYYDEWNAKKQNIEEFAVNNNIVRYLLLCKTRDEEELILDYYSGIDLIPDQIKYLRNKFMLKKKLINNENEFFKVIGDALEFIYIVSKKNILLLFDEVDKVYSSDTNKVRLSAVQAKILTAYRGLFDALNNKCIRGVIAIGATPEAWSILSTQAAFERRFKDNTIILKVPKSKDECEEFIRKRFNEINLEMDNTDKSITKRIIDELSDDKRKTWADVISNIKNYSQKPISINEDPSTEILNVLNDAISPLTWNEIVQESEILKKLYPKAQPTTILKKLVNDNKIKVLDTKPKMYESMSEDYDI